MSNLPVILVVEDDALTRKLVRLTLQDEGYTVIESANGQRALEWLSKTTPALIIQDMRLPDMDGYELLARIRALPACSNVPILAATGLDLSEQANDTFTGGKFTRVLMKPVEPSQLVKTINALLGAEAIAVRSHE
jgi:CheY-like chemotaxis protein